LRIKIDKQNAMAQFRQSSAEIHGRGRFADAAFLICDRDDFHFSQKNGLESGRASPESAVASALIIAALTCR
jgi:hypothetical protein